MASVASELSAVHPAQASPGVRGNAQLAGPQDSANSFGSLLDGTDIGPAPGAAPPSPLGPPTSTPPPAQQGSPDQAADPLQQPPATAAAQVLPQPPDLPASAPTGGPARSDDGKSINLAKGINLVEEALGRLAPIVGKAGKPLVPTNFDVVAQRNGIKAVGQTAAADPNSSVNAASSAADRGAEGATGATFPDRHDDKTGTSDPSPAAAIPSSDAALNLLFAPVPQPVAPVASAPLPTATAADDDGAEITQLAAAGDAARPARVSAQAAGADAAPADATSGGPSTGASADAPATRTPALQQPPSPPAPNSPIERANVGGQPPPNASAPNAFADPGAQPDAARFIRPHATARPTAEALTGPDRERPASVAPDLGQHAGATQNLTAQNLDTAPAANSDGGPVDPRASNLPASIATSPIAAESLAAPVSAATPAVSATAAGQASAPAPATAPAVPIAGLAVEIAGRAHAGKNRFEIRLDPPDLGRIDVRLDVDHDGKVTSHLMVDRQETLDVLRRDAPQIERSLQDAGLKTADNGLQFTLRDQSFGQNPYPRDAPLPGAVRIMAADPDLPAIDTVQGRPGGIAGRGSGIDIRV